MDNLSVKWGSGGFKKGPTIVNKRGFFGKNNTIF